MKRRKLTPEEQDLWRRTVLDVTPASRSAPGVVEPPPPVHRRRKGAAAEVPPLIDRGAPSVRPSSGPAATVIGAGDPAVDRRVARRRLPLDRAIDLHGLTQDQAHARLYAFLRAAHLDGARRLLVITGKGGPGSAASMTRARLYAEAPRAGVLRQRFLDWVDEPALRAMIARVAQAGPRDGGAGAFYVFMKRRPI